MEVIKTLLPIAIQASLFLMVLALALRASPGDVTALIARRGLLARSLLAINVVVPLVATILAAVLPLSPVVRAAIVLMAVSPLPPLAPGKQLKAGGHVSFVAGLLAIVSLLAIVVVPLTLTLLSAIFVADAYVSPWAIGRIVAIGVLLPLGLGMTVHGIAPGAAPRAATILSAVATILMAIGVLPLMIAAAPRIWALVGDGSVLAIATIIVAALTAGHLLGGPDPDDRTTLAIASATRHPGIALLIARTNFPGTDVPAAVLLFMVVSIVVAIPYQVWRTRQRHATHGAEASAPRHAVSGADLHARRRSDHA